MYHVTHAGLVERAVTWLTKSKRCLFVLSEMQCNWLESPDAIGFSRSHSILVECKTSRADFKRDRQKGAGVAEGHLHWQCMNCKHLFLMETRDARPSQD